METRTVTLLVALSTLTACAEADDTIDTSQDSPVSDFNSDWNWATLVPAQGTRWVFRNTVSDEDFDAVIGKDEEIGGRPYTPFMIGDFSTNKTERFLVDLDLSTPFFLEIKRMSWYFAGETEPFESFEIDPPLSLPLYDIVGEQGSFTSSSTQVKGDPIDITATTTLVEKNVTLTVPMGDVPGCRMYHIDILMPFKVPVDVWFQSQYAFVKSTDFVGGAHWDLVSYTPAG